MEKYIISLMNIKKTPHKADIKALCGVVYPVFLSDDILISFPSLTAVILPLKQVEYAGIPLSCRISCTFDENSA